MKDKIITITPFYMDEEILFDADRDNEGTGITPDEMIKMLKGINRAGSLYFSDAAIKKRL